MRLISNKFGNPSIYSYVSFVMRKRETLTPITMTRLTTKQLSELILTLNNTAVGMVEGKWLNFLATNASVRAVKQITGRKVRGVGGVEYQILLSNNPANHI